jgi:F0F1-type ATP synthase alpha subunit
MTNKCPTFTASDAAPLQYLAPYSGCAMGEYFRCGLIVIFISLIIEVNFLRGRVADPPGSCILDVFLSGSRILRLRFPDF